MKEKNIVYVIFIFIKSKIIFMMNILKFQI